MINVIRYENDNYKKCCGNCKFYNATTCECTNSDKIKYYMDKKIWMKACYPSDVGCKYFSFIPNIIYDKKEYKIKVVDVAIKDRDKYLLYSLASCRHLSENGKSLLIRIGSNCVKCKKCKAKFILRRNDNENKKKENLDACRNRL